MDPAFMFGHLDPANHFAMEGLGMAFTVELVQQRGKAFAEDALHGYNGGESPKN